MKSRKIIRFVLKFLGVVAGLILIWIFAALLLPEIKINKNFKNCSGSEKCISLYLRSNGMHTDVVFPVVTPERDWTGLFPPEGFEGVDSTFRYVAVGWGDKGFYLNTPTWDDVTIPTIFAAMIGTSGTAMHIVYLKNAPSVNNEYGKKINISMEQYREMLSYIDRAFVRDENGNVIQIPHPDYDTNDNYYEAKGRYSVFKTCNVWTSDCLKQAGIQNGFWTPSAASVMKSLP